MRIQTTALHHLENELRILANVFAIGSDVGNGEQARELFEDLSLVSAAIVANGCLAVGDSYNYGKDRQRLDELTNQDH